ncbi:MAG: exodeoxyribonuclease I [Spirochaetae bacterium HGW-Spirochaetae-3]|jgi:exodeoxyribonuclease-1|nr:MAG: exodeoxyribonuclease I [Spirochaetae bacterium HGW-Spirochaetae-3]
MAASILWYDLETFGLDPRHDRIAQFAGIRTDDELEPVSDRLVLYSKITPDYLPSPYSCLVHGISPRETLEKGVPEYEFAKAIRTEMLAPGSCVAGYNSIRFDDEFIRNLFYRNLFDPYEREWADGNTRWDVIDLFRATRDLRPDGIIWPDGIDGKPDFRLGSLAAANAVPLESAHDAFHDITATVRLAKLVKEAQPRLYDWYWKHRTRDSLRPLVNLADHEPLVHTAASYTGARGCSTIVAPVGMVPGRRDGLVAIDLRHDPSPLVDLTVDEIRRRVFTRKTELKDGERIPIVNIRLGRCPFLAPMSTMDAKAADRLGLDPDLATERARSLSREPELIQKLQAVFSQPPQDAVEPDPEYRIYSGGFFRDEDKDAMAAVHETIATLGPAEARPQSYGMPFIDERLPQLVRRLFARNWPGTLSRTEAARWRSFCAGRLLCPRIEGATDLAGFTKIVESLLSNLDTPAEDKPMLLQLLEYRGTLEREILSYAKDPAASARDR